PTPSPTAVQTGRWSGHGACGSVPARNGSRRGSGQAAGARPPDAGSTVRQTAPAGAAEGGGATRGAGGRTHPGASGSEPVRPGGEADPHTGDDVRRVPDEPGIARVVRRSRLARRRAHEARITRRASGAGVDDVLEEVGDEIRDRGGQDAFLARRRREEQLA